MSKDYYKVLGVDKKSSADEIKQAFRKLAHQHHPDKESGDESKFKEINEAYQVLGNQEKRQKYDQYGSSFEDMGGFGQGMGWEDFMRATRSQGGNNGGFSFDFGGIDLGDIMGDFFGGGGGRSGRARGQDIQMELEIDFKTAVFGGEEEVELYRTTTCSHCHGNGAEPGTKINTCSECNGHGQVERIQRTIFGSMRTAAMCPKCQGQGSTPEKKCSKCNGRGVAKDNSRIKIKIPAGIDNGQAIKLTGQGEAGAHGGAAGSLYITFRVRQDKRFEREGSDILSEAHIKISQAIFGDKIEVETLDGSVKLKIPEGTQSGEVFKLRGQGVPKLNHYGRGDHLVQVIVDIPKNLSRKDREALEGMGL